MTLPKTLPIFDFVLCRQWSVGQDRRCLGRRKPKRFRDSDENISQLCADEPLKETTAKEEKRHHLVISSHQTSILKKFL